MVQENKNEKKDTSFTALPVESDIEKTIHTMKDDLENKIVPQNIDQKPNANKEIFPKKEKEPEKENPFLDKEEWNKKRGKFEKNPFDKKDNVPHQEKPGSVGSSIVKNGMVDRSEALHLKENNIGKKEVFAEKKEQHGLGGVIAFAAVTAVLIISVISGYYFWMTRFKKEQSEIALPVSQEPASIIPKSPIVPVELSQDKPNFLQIDISKVNAAELKKILKETSDKVAQSGAAAPVEFIVADQQNVPIKFSDFAEKGGLGFSQGAKNLFGDDFSLFFYNDNGNVRLGLAVSLVGVDFGKTILQEEGVLIQGLSPLYMDTQYSLSDNVVFRSSLYGSKSIRYVNIISPEDLSIDYYVSDKKFVVGTTKMTLRSILDYIDQKTSKDAGLDILNDATVE